MARKVCEGTGSRPEIKGIYPFCPVCSKEFSGQGPAWTKRNQGVYSEVPRHFVTSDNGKTQRVAV